MIKINEKGTVYNKEFLEKQIFKQDLNNFATHRKKEAFKVNKENVVLLKSYKYK